MDKLEMPIEVFHPFFFEDSVVNLNIDHLDSFCIDPIFCHEIAYFSGANTIQPWENPEQYIPLVLTEWKKVELELQKLFRKRDKQNAMLPMKKGIGLFFECIYWANGRPVRFDHGIDVSPLKIKPVNSSERIQFLLSRPNHYPSFIQLSELMEEQEKQFVRNMAIKNSMKNDSL